MLDVQRDFLFWCFALIFHADPFSVEPVLQRGRCVQLARGRASNFNQHRFRKRSFLFLFLTICLAAYKLNHLFGSKPFI